MKPVVVIGAGFAGLAAALRIRALGWPVVVLEANDQPGGRAAVFQRDGFTYDAGPTVITAPYLLDELFQLVGRDPKDYYELLPVDPFYRVLFPDGAQFDYVGEEDRILEQIRELSPQDVDGYRALANDAREIFEVGYNGLVDAPFDRVSDMLRVVPQMLKLRSDLTVWQMVSRRIRDHRLRQAFTFQPLLVGGSPTRTSSIYLLIHWLERKWGVYYAKGGTGSLIRALTKVLGELGVEVRCNAPVTEIEVTNGRTTAVRLESGERIETDQVVCNGDPSFIYTRLVGKQHRTWHSDFLVNRRSPSMSLFVAYFGANRTYEKVAHHTIVLGPRYEGLLDDIFVNKRLADDFSLYLHAPSRTDASMSPPGKEGFYVLSPVPNQRSGLDWEKESGPYLERILSALDKGPLAGINASLEHSFTVDPRYFESRLRSVDGAAFGLEPSLTQSAWFRYHNRSEDIDGLWFVGASTHPGAGVPGVLNSAKVLERMFPRPAAGQGDHLAAAAK